jgi:hypothetical protein
VKGLLNDHSYGVMLLLLNVIWSTDIFPATALALNLPTTVSPAMIACAAYTASDALCDAGRWWTTEHVTGGSLACDVVAS